MPKNPRRVLLVLGWYDYRLHRGIEKYAQEHRWHLSEDLAREKVIPWGWEGDGILAWLGAGDDLADFVVQAKKPTVDFSYRRPQLKFPRVLADHARCAQLVADHYLARGFTHFMYYSDVNNWAFEETGRGFVQAVEHAGYGCIWLRWHKSPAFTSGKHQWKRKRDWLAARLKQAPKPVAVFAATDGRALDVLESCESAGLRVPEQVSIIGMDNSLLAVEAMKTPISSVDTNLESVGYRGAALLDELMNGGRPPKEPVRIQPAGLIARKSSDILAVNHDGIARSLRHMWEHFHEPIGVDDLARVAAMSRRGFHQAFVEHIGRPPGHELHRIRIERAKALLALSDHKTETVAEMCGYGNSNSFWVAFRQATGVSPKKYRESSVPKTPV
jgi:LacI family transcriptional regulator